MSPFRRRLFVKRVNPRQHPLLADRPRRDADALGQFRIGHRAEQPQFGLRPFVPDGHFAGIFDGPSVETFPALLREYARQNCMAGLFSLPPEPVTQRRQPSTV